jgi:hypothetical protein
MKLFPNSRIAIETPEMPMPVLTNWGQQIAGII